MDFTIEVEESQDFSSSVLPAVSNLDTSESPFVDDDFNDILLDLNPRGYFKSLRERIGENGMSDEAVLVHKLFALYEKIGIDIPLIEIRKFSIDEISEEITKAESLFPDEDFLIEAFVVANRGKVINLLSEFDLKLQERGAVPLKKNFSLLELRGIYQRMDLSQLSSLYRSYQLYGNKK